MSNSNITPKILLRIEGNKKRQGGFTAIANIGVFPDAEAGKRDRITTLNEKPVYIIKHTEHFLIYQIFDRMVKPCDSDPSGILVVSLAIPRGYRFSEEQSPYTLLKEVYNTFVSQYMRRTSDGRDEFLDEDCDNSIFLSILEKYTLESADSFYVRMPATGPIGMLRVTTEEERTELFKDTQYPEFRQFKEIEVGQNCSSSQELENLRFPRPSEISLYVNGGFDSKIADPNQEIIIDEFRTETHKYQRISFTWQEVKEGMNSRNEYVKEGAKFTFNHGEQKLYCTQKQEDITYSLDIKVLDEKGKELEGVTHTLRQKIAEGAVKICNNKGDCINPYRFVKGDIEGRLQIDPNELEGYKLEYKDKRKGKGDTYIFVIQAKEIVKDHSFTSNNQSQTKQFRGMNTNLVTTISDHHNHTQTDDYEEDTSYKKSGNSNVKLTKKGIIIFIASNIISFLLGIAIPVAFYTIEEGKKEKEAIEAKQQLESLANFLSESADRVEEIKNKSLEIKEKAKTRFDSIRTVADKKKLDKQKKLATINGCIDDISTYLLDISKYKDSIEEKIQKAKTMIGDRNERELMLHLRGMEENKRDVELAIVTIESYKREAELKKDEIEKLPENPSQNKANPANKNRPNVNEESHASDNGAREAIFALIATKNLVAVRNHPQYKKAFTQEERIKIESAIDKNKYNKDYEYKNQKIGRAKSGRIQQLIKEMPTTNMIEIEVLQTEIIKILNE